jgi:hypothetical protein
MFKKYAIAVALISSAAQANAGTITVFCQVAGLRTVCAQSVGLAQRLVDQD